MEKSRKIPMIVGLMIHLLVGGLMIFAGSGKAFGFAPRQIVESMKTYGLGDKLVLIGGGELVTAMLLLIPVTSSLGVLLTSAFWGGVICIHMAHRESYVFPSLLLVLTWVGAYLRDPMILASFTNRTRSESRS